MKTRTEFIEWARGRKIDTDGCPADQPYQCADVIKCAMKQVWNIPNFTFTTPSNPRGFARGLYDNFDEYPMLKGKFIKLPITAIDFPQKGDIVEWGYYKGVTTEKGHTAFAEGRSIPANNQFISLDQNWGKKYYCADTTHNFKGVLGVIRPLLRCTTANLNVRSGAGTNYPKVDELPKGTLVKPLEYSGTWVRIGKNRWVSANYLE